MEPLLETNKIYVRGLPEEVTENALSEHFEKYGRVSKATVAMDGLTRKPRDFGFVSFVDEESAKAAVADVEDHVILGTKVEVKEAIRWERSPIRDNEGDMSANCTCIRNDLRQGKKIFVGGLPHDLTAEEFKSFFESFGKTTDVVIMVDKVSRISRGFGFVTYESEESARAALTTSHYLIRGKEVEVKVSIPKNVSNTTERPDVYPQGHHHPYAVINGYHHYPSFRPMHGMILGPPHANSAPIYPYPYVNGMAATSPAHALNGFHGYKGHARTASNGDRAAAMPAPRPFTKIRISKPPGKIEKDSACSPSASCVEDPSPASEDSNIDGRPSPSGIYDGKDQASENGHND